MMKLADLRNVRIFKTLKALWQRLRPQKIAQTVEIEVKPSPTPEKEEDQLSLGLANAISIHDILDYLPGYFDDLKALWKFDPSAYSIMSSLGGVVVPEDSGFSIKELPEGSLDKPPLLRCVFFKKSEQHSKKDDTYSPAILYMMQVKGGMTYVAREGYYSHLPAGICYRVVLVYNTDMGSFAASFFVHYDTNYKLSVVKESKVSPQVLRHKGNKGKSSVFYARKSTIPKILLDMAGEREKFDKEKLTPEQVATMLCNLCLSAKRPSEAILVRANKSGMTASWTIDRRDGKRFFAKRVTGSATDGKRKRILHYVGDFVRASEGRTSYVREHYRGERSFSWMGYGIEVSGLGFHHDDFYDASIETVEIEGNDIPRGFVSLEKAVDGIKQHYSKSYRAPRAQKPRRAMSR